MKHNNVIEHKTLCFLSDDLTHDVTAVITFQKHVLNYIKENYPHIKSVEYWSDGCAEQYKNCHNFLFLCQYMKNFGIDVTWRFFATAHGKSACDGVRGLLKRDAAIESLKRVYENQILTVQELFEYLKEKFKEIKIFLVLKEEIDVNRKEFTSTVEQNVTTQSWFGDFKLSLAQTVPGTRGYHAIKSLSEEVIACRTTSYDSISFKFNIIKKKIYNWRAKTFVSFVHKMEWQIGFILDIHGEELEASISILNSNIYEWPLNKRISFIPFDQILQTVQVQEKNNKMKVKLGQNPSLINLLKSKILKDYRYFL